MKCPEALVAMLDAEPAELSPDGQSALAAHLRSCARCAQVAATMRVDLHALAVAMPAVPVATPTPWGRWSGVALASAAAVLLFAVTRGRSVPTVRPQPADTTPAVVARPAEPVQAPATPPPAQATTPVRRVASALYAMPDPVPLDAAGGLDARDSTLPAFRPAKEPAFDGVSATSDGSVTVLKTSNPKITVIWFH